MTPASRLDGLQALRGLAAMYVFLFHLAPVSGLAGAYPAIGGIARWGFAGVDLFFVLSGFVIWHATHDARGPGAARRFLLRRFARIYLGYWPMLLIAGTMFALLAPQVLREANLAGSLLLVEPHDRRLVIGVSWSLTFELYFYGLFAGLLLIGRTRRLLVVAAILAGVTVFNLWLLARFPERLDGGATEGFFFLSPFVAEFCAGALAAAAWRAGFPGLGRRRVAAIGIVLLAGGTWAGVGGGALPAHQVERLLSFGPAALGLLLLVLALGDRIAWPRWAVALGDQSYALYLGHPVALSLFSLLGAFPADGHPLPVAALAAATLVATAQYSRFVEYPAYRSACRVLDRLR